MSEQSENIRGGYRFLAGLKAELALEKSTFPCRAVDLNRDGVLVEGEFDPAGHSVAGIRLLSASEDLSFSAQGRVARVSRNELSGLVKLGIEFDALAPAQTEVLERLLSRIIEGTKPASLANLEKGASIPEIRDALGKIPIAHRITLARRALPAERAFFKHDESPQVIEALCRNPQITRPELMELLKLPMLLPSTLEVLSRDKRWTTHEEIRIVIATHPRVTFQVAESMIEGLSLNGIRQIIRRPGLNPVLKSRLVAHVPHKQLQGW